MLMTTDTFIYFVLSEVDALRYVTVSEYRGDEYISESFLHLPGSANSR